MKRGTDYIGAAVGAAIFNAEGKLFITKRGQKANNDRGKWEIPGGGVEFGELREDAVKREIKEENDIDIEVIDTLCTTDHLLPDERQQWIATTFICRLVRGEAKILEPDKCEALDWVTFEEAEALDLSSITRHDLELLKNRYPRGFVAS